MSGEILRTSPPGLKKETQISREQAARRTGPGAPEAGLGLGVKFIVSRPQSVSTMPPPAHSAESLGGKWEASGFRRQASGRGVSASAGA